MGAPSSSARLAFTSGYVYAWEGCDPTIIDELPDFNFGGLQALIEAREGASPAAGPLSRGPVGRPHPNVTKTAPLPRQRSMVLRDGSRGLSLNDHLCGQVWGCESLDQVLDVARTFAEAQVEHGLDPLDDAEVVE